MLLFSTCTLLHAQTSSSPDAGHFSAQETALGQAVALRRSPFTCIVCTYLHSQTRGHRPEITDVLLTHLSSRACVSWTVTAYTHTLIHTCWCQRAPGSSGSSNIWTCPTAVQTSGHAGEFIFIRILKKKNGTTRPKVSMAEQGRC